MSKKAVPNESANSVNKKVSANENDLPKKDNALKVLLRSPLCKSIGLHSVILISLLVSFNFSAKPLKFVAPEASASAVQPEIVNATFIDSNVIEQAKREKAQAEASAQRRQQQEAQRKEDIRKKQVAQAKQKREAEKEQQDKLQREQDKERAVAQKLAEQREQEQKDEAQRKKRQEELDQALTQQLEAEQASMSQANQRRVLSEVQKYKALVHSKVQQFLETDGGFIGETCLINVRLAPDGLVLRAEAVSGKPALCRIAKAAVLRAQTLPMSKDPEVMAQFRQFDIEVSPER